MESNVWLIVEVVSLIATVVLGYLMYLVLFERGASYRIESRIDALDDDARLQLLSAVLATPVSAIRSAELIREGSELYESQLAAIRAAMNTVHLETYIYYPGKIADAILDALCERARSGVRVRVIVDAIGSFRTPHSVFAHLVAAGGTVHRYHALGWRTFRRWNNRTHRNLLVLDGTVAFVGGAGIADHWARSDPAPWRDCLVRVTGPIVAGLQAVFAENWLECSGDVLVDAGSFPSLDVSPIRPDLPEIPGLAVGSTPTAGRSTRARILVQFLLASARESIELCSPYFVPDLGIRDELMAARDRNVRVRVLTGGPYSDHGIVRRAGRRRYGALLAGGVEIWEYAPRMMHAKVLVIDGKWALLGSTNIDNRSFGLNDEVNLLLVSPILGAQLQELFEHDLAFSHALDVASWHARTWVERTLATLGRIIERHQ